MRNTKIESCRYGPDGKVQKTPLSAPAEKEEDTPRGPKARVKAGDSLVLTLDAAGKGTKQVGVDTWMDSPSDKVTLNVEMQSLPDGTSYAGNIVLAVPSSHIEVRITNANYQKLAQ